ncbi:MAG: hypothetical protein ACXV3F_12255 [Frankiaceae bacterium]
MSEPEVTSGGEQLVTGPLGSGDRSIGAIHATSVWWSFAIAAAVTW